MSQSLLQQVVDEIMAAADAYRWQKLRMADVNDARSELERVVRAAIQQQPEPVAWVDPRTCDIISAERKHAWLNDYGQGGKKKAANYTQPLYTAPALQQQEVPSELSGESMAQREEVCAAWADLPDELRKDPRMTRLYRALGGVRMDDPSPSATRQQEVGNTLGVALLDSGHPDTRRMDWLEQAYSDGARDEKSWREFMTRVAEFGFRTAIDRTTGVALPDGGDQG